MNQLGEMRETLCRPMYLRRANASAKMAVSGVGVRGILDRLQSANYTPPREEALVLAARIEELEAELTFKRVREDSRPGRAL